MRVREREEGRGERRRYVHACVPTDREDKRVELQENEENRRDGLYMSVEQHMAEERGKRGEGEKERRVWDG